MLLLADLLSKSNAEDTEPTLFFLDAVQDDKILGSR